MRWGKFHLNRISVRIKNCISHFLCRVLIRLNGTVTEVRHRLLITTHYSLWLYKLILALKWMLFQLISASIARISPVSQQSNRKHSHLRMRDMLGGSLSGHLVFASITPQGASNEGCLWVWTVGSTRCLTILQGYCVISEGWRLRVSPNKFKFNPVHSRVKGTLKKRIFIYIKDKSIWFTKCINLLTPVT